MRDYSRAELSERAPEPFERNPGGRILVADDDAAMRSLLVELLLDDGYEVYDARDGLELVAIAQAITVDAEPAEIFDLLVVDNTMPGISGIEALRRLRRARCETPAVLLTAFPDEAVHRAAIELRVPLLAKPFATRALSDVVLTCLLARRAAAGAFPAT